MKLLTAAAQRQHVQGCWRTLAHDITASKFRIFTAQHIRRTRRQPVQGCWRTLAHDIRTEINLKE
jgi:hypothetical protein